MSHLIGRDEAHVVSAAAREVVAGRLGGLGDIAYAVIGTSGQLTGSRLLDLPFLLIFLAVMFFYSWQLSLIAMGMLALACVVGTATALFPPARLAAQAPTKLGVRAGDSITVADAIQAMTTLSANDAAVAMAMGHVIMKEFYFDKRSAYFDDYARRYTDLPMLVMLKEHVSRLPAPSSA